MWTSEKANQSFFLTLVCNSMARSKVIQSGHNPGFNVETHIHADFP